jgi:hypothetical protein
LTVTEPMLGKLKSFPEFAAVPPTMFPLITTEPMPPSPTEMAALATPPAGQAIRQR